MYPSPQNIYLRPFELSDVSAFTTAVNASLDSLIPWMVWAHHDYQPHEAESWIRFTHWQRMKEEAEEFAIVDQHDQLLGAQEYALPVIRVTPAQLATGFVVMPSVRESPAARWPRCCRWGFHAQRPG